MAWDRRLIYLDGIARAEYKLQPIHLARIQRVVIHYPDVHGPLFQVVRFDQCYARRERSLELQHVSLWLNVVSRGLWLGVPFAAPSIR
jgi:hypothetical protein